MNGFHFCNSVAIKCANILLKGILLQHQEIALLISDDCGSSFGVVEKGNFTKGIPLPQLRYFFELHKVFVGCRLVNKDFNTPIYDDIEGITLIPLLEYLLSFFKSLHIEVLTKFEEVWFSFISS